jgi:methionyl-tRNA formyltransferase
MRVLFVGASAFGKKCLEEISRLPEISLVGVITAPKTFSISYSKAQVTNVLHSDFTEWAAAHQLPCFVMQQGMNDPTLLDWVTVLKPQFIVVVGWYHLLPRSLREIAPAIGLHASLLPDYSGGAPLVWAMINGETETGITLFQLADGVDSGPVYGQAREEIRPDDTIATLYARIEKQGLQLLRTQLPRIARQEAVPWLQDESKRRVFPQRSPADGRINWNLDAGSVDRFIRAQTRPYPGAFTTLHGEHLTIWAASTSADSEVRDPGRVIRDGNFCRVCCGSGSIVVEAAKFRNADLAREGLATLLGNGGQVFGK